MANEKLITLENLSTFKDKIVALIPTVNNSTITIQKNGSTVDSFTTNAASAKSINIAVPTGDADLTNNRYVRFDAELTGTSAYSSTQQGYARKNIGAAAVSDITSTVIANALGFTPYDASNPDGYTTNAGTITQIKVNGTSIATSGVANIQTSDLSLKDSDLTNDRYVRFDSNAQGLTSTQKSNARTNIGAGTSSLELGGNGSATTASKSDHTHTLIISSGGSSPTELAANTTYTLTAGGSQVVIKTPAGKEYSFDTGSTNGSISVTPSGGSATDVAVKGLAAAAYKGVATSVSSSSTDSDVATAKAVYDAIEALPEPMIFKGSLGTGGTITSLPTAGSSYEGHTYKVITAGTYASTAAKVGDTFICAKTGTSTYEWVLIPSGDEPSGTVTSVGLQNAENGGLSISGSPITSSGTITVGLASGYGDTKFPFTASKTKNYVLASPSSADGAPSFRALVKADLPSLSASDVGALASSQEFKSIKTSSTGQSEVSGGESTKGSGDITLHKVAKTGSYNDLLNTPSIPDDITDLGVSFASTSDINGLFSE